MRQRIVPFLFLLLLLALPAAHGQAVVRWEKSDDPAELTLTFENCAPDGDPQLPVVAGVQFVPGGTSNRTESTLGPGGFTSKSTVGITYRLRSRTATPVAIPAFAVKTDKGTIRVPAFTAAAVRSAVADGTATSRFEPSSLTVWAGEVFSLTYTLDVVRRNFGSLGTNPDWSATPLVSEEWSKPEGADALVNGEPHVNVIYKFRAYAKAAGPLALNSVSQAVNLQTGSIGFGLFSTPRVEQVALESNRPQLTVRALPPAPAGFSGAVGQFQLVSKVVPEKANIGEPVTWTLELRGTGNWPDLAGLPPRDVSSDFQVVQPKARRTPAEGKLFDVTLAEDVVLVPTKPGNYALGPVSFVYFDPKSGGYKTITTPRTTVAIAAPNAPKPATVAPATSAEPAPSAGPTQSEIENLKSKTPAPLAGIPRDPLPGAAQASTPLSAKTLLLCLLSPVLCLLFFWLWLALRCARQTDPLRPHREAHARLAATLAQLRNSQLSASRPEPVERLSSQLLLAWQHDTAVLWRISHAAPPATALSDAAWSTLWSESDRALYGAQTALPTDWVARAEAALAAKRVPGFQPFRLFLPRNLLPFAALFVFCLLSPVAGLLLTARAADAPTAYRSGDFATAEKAWRATLAKTPTDWIARHNLSLSLAQQDHAGEAAAQAAAAFVQNPADLAVRWHFTFASEKAGFAPAPLAGFIAPGPFQSLAQLASPASWQFALIGAVVAAALAAGWMLFNSYGRRSRAIFWSAFGAMTVCLLFAATAVLGWLAYGIAARENAVVAWRAGTLRSIPTEADTTQKTTPLPAGSVALVDKTFLNDRWQRLVFETGQTGWVRQEELVSLWK